MCPVRSVTYVSGRSKGLGSRRERQVSTDLIRYVLSLII